MVENKIRLKLISYDPKLLDEAVKKIIESAKITGGIIKGPIPLPVRKRRWCVLRSPHKFDQSKEHFELREHRRLLEIHKPTPQTLENLERLFIPAGVYIEIKMM